MYWQPSSSRRRHVCSCLLVSSICAQLAGAFIIHLHAELCSVAHWLRLSKLKPNEKFLTPVVLFLYIPKDMEQTLQIC
jgi:hypothetical protein